MHALHNPDYIWWYWGQTRGRPGMWLWSPEHRGCDARRRVRTSFYKFSAAVAYCQLHPLLPVCLLQSVRRFRRWRRRSGHIQKKRRGVWDFQRGSGPVWPVLPGAGGLREQVWHCHNESAIWDKTQPRWVHGLILPIYCFICLLKSSYSWSSRDWGVLPDKPPAVFSQRERFTLSNTTWHCSVHWTRSEAPFWVRSVRGTDQICRVWNEPLVVTRQPPKSASPPLFFGPWVGCDGSSFVHLRAHLPTVQEVTQIGYQGNYFLLELTETSW